MSVVQKQINTSFGSWSCWVRRYVDLGWVLVPVVPALKEPHKVLLNEIYGDSRVSILEEAPPLLIEVEYWFHKEPNLNLAVIPCVRSGIVIADIDSLEAFDPLLPTPTVVSGRVRGGKHLYFLHEKMIPQTKMVWGDLNPAIAVLPGSLHSSGARYRWSEGLSPDDVPFMRLEDAADLLGIGHLL